MRLSLILLFLLANIASALAGNDVPDASDLQHPIKNYQRADFGVAAGIATGGSLSRNSLEELKSHGVKQIIDLRQPAEGIQQERDWSQQLGIAYANFPVGSELPDGQLIKQVGMLLNSAADTPTVMHCGSGHRAGIVLALYLHQQGMTVDNALEQARVAGTRENAIDALRQRMEQ